MWQAEAPGKRRKRSRGRQGHPPCHSSPGPFPSPPRGAHSFRNLSRNLTERNHEKH